MLTDPRPLGQLCLGSQTLAQRLHGLCCWSRGSSTELDRYKSTPDPLGLEGDVLKPVPHGERAGHG